MGGQPPGADGLAEAAEIAVKGRTHGMVGPGQQIFGPAPGQAVAGEEFTFPGTAAATPAMGGQVAGQDGGV